MQLHSKLGRPLRHLALSLMAAMGDHIHEPMLQRVFGPKKSAHLATRTQKSKYAFWSHVKPCAQKDLALPLGNMQGVEGLGLRVSDLGYPKP